MFSSPDNPCQTLCLHQADGTPFDPSRRKRARLLSPAGRSHNTAAARAATTNTNNPHPFSSSTAPGDSTGTTAADDHPPEAATASAPFAPTRASAWRGGSGALAGGRGSRGGGRERGRGRGGARGDGRAAVLRSLTGRGGRPQEEGHPGVSRLEAGPPGAGRFGVSVSPEAGDRFIPGQAAGRDPRQGGDSSASGTARFVSTTSTAAAAAAAGWRPACEQHGGATGQDASWRNAPGRTDVASYLSALAARRAADGQRPEECHNTGRRAAPTFTDTAALPPTAEAEPCEEGSEEAACEQDAGPRFVYGGGRTAATPSPSDVRCLPVDPSHTPAAPSSHTPAHTATAPAVAAPASRPAGVTPVTAAAAQVGRTGRATGSVRLVQKQQTEVRTGLGPKSMGVAGVFPISLS